jgi:hypothetical protein
MPDCQVSLILNGSTGNTVQVEDGDSITVEIQAIGSCTCCETKRNCEGSQPTTMWMAKSAKENKTIVLKRSALEQKIKFVIERVRKRKRGLRRNN